MDDNLFLELSKKGYSKNNNRLHISSALQYASSLQSIYGGDQEIIEYGIIIKDLVDVNKEFSDFCSVKENLELVFSRTSLSTQKIELISDYLIERKERTKSSYSIEEKIIEDSTSLSWNGMKGIVKLLQYSENKGIDLLHAIEEINRNSSPFFFAESTNTAEREKKFNNLFKGCLNIENRLATSYPGKYLILEGNSGVGKDVQADLLQKQLVALGRKVLIFQEPSPSFREFEKMWNEKNNVTLSLDLPTFRMYAILGDRKEQIEAKIQNALNEGYVVISVRSFLSMLVYQCKCVDDQLFVNYLHQFNPKPDCVIIYDLDEEIALERIKKRGGKVSIYDKLPMLQEHRPKYLELPQLDFLGYPIKVIDAAGTIDEIAEATISFIRETIG